eukprot:Partr_v1_DN23887_c0_g1_i2_m63926 putative nudix (nucleoside diphosphate linked moiety X)-type motif 5
MFENEPWMDLDLPPIPQGRNVNVSRGKWLTFDEYHYVDPVSQTTRVWEYCQRVQHNPPKSPISPRTRDRVIDSIEICAVLSSQNKADHLILVLQYRPAINRFSIEFPAGLIDEGETPETAAICEMREETGYVISPNSIVADAGIQAMYNEPGISSTNTRIVKVHINGDLTENQNPQHRREAEEEWSMQTILLPIDRQLIRRLEWLEKNRGIGIDAKLYTFALGISFFPSSA